MKTLIVAVNAKFIHSSLSVRALRAACSRPDRPVSTVEFTINQPEPYIVSEIFKLRPDVLGFSCYVWNIEAVLSVVGTLKKIMPKTLIILGGPEAAYDEARLLREYPVDFVATGQGEDALPQILDAIENGTEYEPRLTVQKPMSDFPFPYEDEDMEALRKKIIYYETSRGCPFQCSYCLSARTGKSSGGEAGFAEGKTSDRTGKSSGSEAGFAEGKTSDLHESRTDFLPLSRVFKELEFFLAHGVRQVKFVDRTFNCDKARARAIWEFIMRKDKGITNFHFEIAADLLDEETLGLLESARPGLFQFEAGIQSFHPDTLRAVNRKTDLTLLQDRVKTVKSFGNIHLHLDLIAGLPFEDYKRFQASFNLTYRLEPEQLQLGFLKILKGSPLSKQAMEYGIAYNDKAPYEVLFTNWISYEELLRLKAVEEMVALFYNSGKFKATLSYVVDFFESPFCFFEALSLYWEERGLQHTQHRTLELYEIMRDFLAPQPVETNIIRDFLKYDLLIHDRVSLPEWLEGTADKEEKALLRKTCKSFRGICQAEKFDWDILFWLTKKTLHEKKHYLIFHYDAEDRLTGKIRGRADYITEPVP